VKLICRVYDPTEGKILVDGIDLKDINLDHWRDYPWQR
jgi:ATP-binding cassette subfamily B protein